MQRTAVLLLLSAFLAGCGDSPTPEDDPLRGPDVTTGPDTGAISGVVVSETIVPIEGATVALPDGTNATTDTGGVFVLRDLDPGVYFLTVSAPGFLPAQTSAEVQAGAVAKPRILLAADTSPQPYKQTLTHAGFIRVWGGIASFFVTATAPEASECDCTMTFVPDEQAATYVLEAIYDENLESPVPHFGYYWELDQTVPDVIQTSGYGHSPIVAHIAASTFDEQDEMRARFTGPDEWIAIDQSFELYVTVFYLEAAPEGWSFVAGDT